MSDEKIEVTYESSEDFNGSEKTFSNSERLELLRRVSLFYSWIKANGYWGSFLKWKPEAFYWFNGHGNPLPTKERRKSRAEKIANGDGDYVSREERNEEIINFFAESLKLKNEALLEKDFEIARLSEENQKLKNGGQNKDVIEEIRNHLFLADDTLDEAIDLMKQTWPRD